jgi:GDPmannose 4,6-dehydratase
MVTKSKTALITGINGMDGSHMCDLLLSKKYKVYGMERHRTNVDRANIAHIMDRIEIIKGDLSDIGSIHRILNISKPDEIYNFAAQSFVGDSWALPEHTGNITGMGVLRMLEAMRSYPDTKLVQASTSEMFGQLNVDIADENSRFYPRNPYGVAKVFGHHIVQNYRESYDLFACASISFNHESERRGMQFVTRKITHHVAKIHLGLANEIRLGNLEPRRDWGYAPDYVEGIWKMLQLDEPQDFVLATGISHSVEDFVKAAFAVVNIEDWERYIVEDPKFMRPAEVDYLRGDASKAKEILGWEPTVQFKEIVERMVTNDIKLLRGEVIG